MLEPRARQRQKRKVKRTPATTDESMACVSPGFNTTWTPGARYTEGESWIW